MYEGIIQDIIDELGRLPGVGPKSAQRIAFHIIASDRIDVARLAEVLKTVKERVKFCTTCGNISEEDLCKICRDPRRDNTSICVVEESKDVIAIEKTREFKGKYHVLGGAISPNVMIVAKPIQNFQYPQSAHKYLDNNQNIQFKEENFGH